jgi:hypothetical protein
MFALRLECASITTLRPHHIGVLDPLSSIHLLVCWKFGIVRTASATFAVSAIPDIEQSAHSWGVVKELQDRRRVESKQVVIHQNRAILQ